MTIRIHKIDLAHGGLRQLEDHLDQIGFEKYDIVPPSPFMPEPDFPFDPCFDEGDEE